jgi:hypothetical protein
MGREEGELDKVEVGKLDKNIGDGVEDDLGGRNMGCPVWIREGLLVIFPVGRLVGQFKGKQEGSIERGQIGAEYGGREGGLVG